MEHLLASALADVGFELRPQWRLAGVGFEGGDFSFEVIANFDDRGCWRERDRLAVGQGEVRSAVVKLLGSVRSYGSCNLVGIAVVSSRPVKCQRGEN